MNPRIEQTLDDRVREARHFALEPIWHMNRKERRTAHGKVKVAEAEAKALAEENRVLREELEDLKR